MDCLASFNRGSAERETKFPLTQWNTRNNYMTVKHWLDKTFYKHFQDNWDDQLFRERILQYLKPEHKILDLGAGAGIVPQMAFRGLVKRVVGLDPDPRVASNPYLDDAVASYAEVLPFQGETFDVIVSDNVFEHLSDPVTVLKEVKRVLKPGGYILLKTPNRKHYVPLIARLSPHWFHAFVNRFRGRDSEDTFPTLYRANSISQVKRLAQDSGMRVASIELVEGRPEYLRLIWPLYVLGILYERTVNKFRMLKNFRVLLIGALQRQP